jgi:protein-S-isoprenylcysteine O-methyltransferase Ste14
MISLSLPEPFMLALRWGLLLGPIALVLVIVRLRNPSQRARIGGLFAFLYGVSMVFVTHSLAIWLGWWTYGWESLMLNGLPADIVIGGAVLFGPGLYFAFPDTRPIMICLPIVIGLHATIFSSLEPLVYAGPYWFAGVVFVFVTAHIPAIYLAQWTAEDRFLPLRCILLAIMTGGMIFAILPSLILHAMGGSWDLSDRSVLSLTLTAVLLCGTIVIGLSANQMLCIQGAGTPIPLDPTQRLVRTGVYAYVSNPMQLSAALAWVFLGTILGNIWIILAALMAWVFVQGMVRWHHRHDLLKRFPEGWPEYKANVPEWMPRWQPWLPDTAVLVLAPRHRRLRALLSHATALEIRTGEGRARYDSPAEIRGFDGAAACLIALTHINFAWMLVAQTGLMLVLGVQYFRSLLPKRAGAVA